MYPLLHGPTPRVLPLGRGLCPHKAAVAGMIVVVVVVVLILSVAAIPSHNGAGTPFHPVRVWADSACFELEEKVYLKFSVKLGCSPRYTPIVPKWNLAGQLAETDFFNTCVRRNVQKFSFFTRGKIWVDLGCLEMEEKVYLKLWVKLGFSPRYTQTVPKCTWSPLVCVRGENYQGETDGQQGKAGDQMSKAEVLECPALSAGTPCVCARCARSADPPARLPLNVTPHC